jgi:hypothetical protein
MLNHHCLACGAVTPHRHLHDTAHGIIATHMVGTERFVCTVCDRTTFAYSDGADTFRFVLDGAANERVRA